MEWAPDCRAIAVGYMHAGLVVWSPSGCRLLCTLRQVPNTVGRDSMSLAGTTSGSLVPSARTTQHAWDISSALSGGLGSGGAPGFGPPATASLDSTGVSSLSWGPQGYLLTVGLAGGASQLVELQFARSLPHHHRVAHAGPGWLGASPAGAGGLPGAPSAGSGSMQAGAASSVLQQQPGEELHVLQAHDRMLVIAESVQASGAWAGGGGGAGAAGGGKGRGNVVAMGAEAEGGGLGSDLLVSHVVLPYQYISANWPVMHAAVSSSGMDIAVAGRHGLALYSRAADK